MRTPLRTILAASVAVTLTAAAFAAPVAAGSDKKGTTTIAPSGTTLSVFQKVLKPGKFNAAETTVSFRIVGNPSKGPIKHVGGLQVDGSAGILEDEDLKLRNFRIKVPQGLVYGKVEGFGIHSARAVGLYPSATVALGACPRIALANRTIMDAFTAQPVVLRTPGPSPLRPHMLVSAP